MADIEVLSQPSNLEESVVVDDVQIDTGSPATQPLLGGASRTVQINISITLPEALVPHINLAPTVRLDSDRLDISTVFQGRWRRIPIWHILGSASFLIVFLALGGRSWDLGKRWETHFTVPLFIPIIATFAPLLDLTLMWAVCLTIRRQSRFFKQDMEVFAVLHALLFTLYFVLMILATVFQNQRGYSYYYWRRDYNNIAFGCLLAGLIGLMVTKLVGAFIVIRKLKAMKVQADANPLLNPSEQHERRSSDIETGDQGKIYLK